MENPISWYVRTVYRHQELRFQSGTDDSPTFRLLHLFPGTSDADLKGTLREYPLPATSAPEYCCLSYRWVGKDASRFILLDGKRIELWESLWAFLRVLRSPTETLTIWADAICIDQDNLLERSNQVGWMGEIYRKATQVHVWLGEAADGSTQLFEWAAEMHDAPNSQALPVSMQGSFAALSRRPYWSRVWMIQECVMARDIILHCGSTSIRWDHLFQQGLLFPSESRPSPEDDCQQSFGDEPLEDHPDDALAKLRQCMSVMNLGEAVGEKDPFLFCRLLVNARNGLCPHFHCQKQTETLLGVHTGLDTAEELSPFLRFLGSFNRSECSMPQDKLYALVPLASLICGKQDDFPRNRRTTCAHSRPESHHAITPDYSLSLHEAMVKLAFVQGTGKVAQAWRFLSDTFRTELGPPQSAVYFKLCKTDKLLKGIMIGYTVTFCDVRPLTEPQPSIEHLRKEFVEAFRQILLRLSSRGKDFLFETLSNGNNHLLISSNRAVEASDGVEELQVQDFSFREQRLYSGDCDLHFEIFPPGDRLRFGEPSLGVEDTSQRQTSNYVWLRF